MKTDIYTVKGEKKDTIDLPDHVFGVDVSVGSVYHAVRNELANSRVGTACTKTRSEVNARHQKPYRQKGTGRARAGRTSSPVWVGGGVVFGPRGRDYSYSIPRKIKKLALKSLLSMKVVKNAVNVVEDFTVESGKTRDLLLVFSGVFSNLLNGLGRVIVIMGEDDLMLRRAARNIPNIRIVMYNRLEAHMLFYADKLLFFRTSVARLEDFYS